MEEHSTQDVRLAGLRQVLVERLVFGMYELREVGGPRCTPYMQLALATELEQCEGRDRAALDSLLARTVSFYKAKCHNRSKPRVFKIRPDNLCDPVDPIYWYEVALVVG